MKYEKSETKVVKEGDPVEDILKKASEKVAEAEKEKEYTVIVNQLNVRTGPSMNAGIFKIVRSGEKLTGVIDGDWLKLKDGNYVKAEYVAPVKKG